MAEMVGEKRLRKCVSIAPAKIVINHKELRGSERFHIGAHDGHYLGPPALCIFTTSIFHLSSLTFIGTLLFF